MIASQNEEQELPSAVDGVDKSESGLQQEEWETPGAVDRVDESESGLQQNANTATPKAHKKRRNEKTIGKELDSDGDPLGSVNK